MTHRSLGAGNGAMSSGAAERGSGAFGCSELDAPGEKSPIDLLFRNSEDVTMTASSLLLRVRRFNELRRRGIALPRTTRDVQSLKAPIRG